MRDFDLKELIDSELQHGHFDPAKIAVHVARKIPDELLRAVVKDLLPNAVRLRIHSMRKAVVGGSISPAEDRNTDDSPQPSRFADKSYLDCSFCGADGEWKPFRDFTVEDCMDRAQHYAGLAESHAVSGKKMEATANLCKRHKCVVGKVPKKALDKVWK